VAIPAVFCLLAECSLPVGCVLFGKANDLDGCVFGNMMFFFGGI